MLDYTPGTIVYVQIGPIKHYGVLSDHRANGLQNVISSSKFKNAVVEENIDDFSQGNTVYSGGFPSNLAPQKVLARARSKIGSAYKLFSDNCEHFVRFVHKQKPESPQLQIAVMCSLVLLAGFLVLRR